MNIEKNIIIVGQVKRGKTIDIWRNGTMKYAKLSKFVSLILRHHPEAVGIKLDEHGWAKVSQLLAGINNTGREISMAILEEIVASDNKQRYSFNEDKTLIRANQGHSISVDVEMQEKTPPSVLYHGTAERFLDSILVYGLKPMGRMYVHLSNDVETAVLVGKRHGKPVVLKVDAQKMAEDGIKFYLSENGVWNTVMVPTEYLEKIEC